MEKLQVVEDFPPNYAKIKLVLNPQDQVVFFAYDNKIYNPSKVGIPPEKIVHEKVHIDRQNLVGVENWWNEYLEKPSFRLEEEMLAYRGEYQFLKRYVKDRELLFHLSRELATNLSSDLYGSVISYSEARKLIVS